VRRPSLVALIATTALVLSAGGNVVAFTALTHDAYDVRNGSIDLVDINPSLRSDLQGEQGPRGFRGVQGLAGARGPSGPVGATGNDGSDLSYEVGSLERIVYGLCGREISYRREGEMWLFTAC
jgi:hypothetical protein